MAFDNLPLLLIELGCVLVGIAVATGGGLLALRADVERPLQCIPVFVGALVVFLGGMALLCWFDPIAKQVASRIAPDILPDKEKRIRNAVEPEAAETALRTHVHRSLPC